MYVKGVNTNKSRLKDIEKLRNADIPKENLDLIEQAVNKSKIIQNYEKRRCTKTIK